MKSITTVSLTWAPAEAAPTRFPGEAQVIVFDSMVRASARTRSEDRHAVHVGEAFGQRIGVSASIRKCGDVSQPQGRICHLLLIYYW